MLDELWCCPALLTPLGICCTEDSCRSSQLNINLGSTLLPPCLQQGHQLLGSSQAPASPLRALWLTFICPPL